MWDERVSPTIDDTAREMTDGAPADGAAFRRCVLARIEAGDASRRSWRAAFVLSPIAAAAAIAIAMGVTRGAHDRSPESVAPQRAETTPTPEHPQSSASETVVARGFQPRERGPERAALHQMQVDAAAGPARDLDTLQLDANGVASIAVAPLAVDTLTPDPIPIERLDTVAPITVAPLDIPDVQRRNE